VGLLLKIFFIRDKFDKSAHGQILFGPAMKLQVTCLMKMTNERMSFDQITPNPKNDQTTGSFELMTPLLLAVFWFWGQNFFGSEKSVRHAIL